MKKLTTIIYIFAVLAIIFYIVNMKQLEKAIFINGKEITVEISDTDEKRTKGLMFRKNLCKDCGMLFVFDKEDMYNFWNMNTYIPLDIIYISENRKIVEIKSLPKYICHLIETNEVCEPLRTNPTKKAKFVLEVNVGFAKTHNIKVGDFVSDLKTVVAE